MMTQNTVDDNVLEDTDDISQSIKITDKKDLLALFDVAACPVINQVDTQSIQKIAQQRLTLYKNQYERTRQLYTVDDTVCPTYLTQTLKPQFIEYQHYQMSLELDKRAVVDIHEIQQLWQQLHVVDDIIRHIVRLMPAQRPVGWQISSAGKNWLQLPTVGRLKKDEDSIADQASINSYVLAHFGVTSFTFDKAYFIGHVLGYLFCCYYFAHLSISYGVSSLKEEIVADFDYATLKTPHLVRLLQTLDLKAKQYVYQLAVICAKLSYYATDKRIEKMLIAEVNDFNKENQQNSIQFLLETGIMLDTDAKLN